MLENQRDHVIYNCRMYIDEYFLITGDYLHLRRCRQNIGGVHIEIRRKLTFPYDGERFFFAGCFIKTAYYTELESEYQLQEYFRGRVTIM